MNKRIRLALGSVATLAVLGTGIGMANADQPTDEVSSTVQADETSADVSAAESGQETLADSEIQAVEDQIAATFDDMGVAYEREDFMGLNVVILPENAPEEQWQVITDAYEAAFPSQTADEIDEAAATAETATETPEELAALQLEQDNLAAFFDQEGIAYERVEVDGLNMVSPLDDSQATYDALDRFYSGLADDTGTADAQPSETE